MQYLSPLVFCVLPTLEHESSFCNPNWLFEGNFGIHIFFLGMAKVKKALARMFLKKVGEWTQKLKQNFNFIKFNFIFSKQQTHYKSHCEVQGYKRLQPPPRYL